MSSKEECEVLLTPILNAAEKFLVKNKELIPFGCVMNVDNSIVFTAADNGDEFPESKAIIEELKSAHRRSAMLLYLTLPILSFFRPDKG